MENIDAFLDILKLQKEEHSTSTQEIESLLKRETETLKHHLETYKPIYDWYKENNFVFTHPTIKLRSTSGPILAFDDTEDEVIVFNVNKGYPEKVYLHDNEKRRPYNLHSLVRDGHFRTAKAGILYLEKMMANYLQRNQEEIMRLKAELEE